MSGASPFVGRGAEIEALSAHLGGAGTRPSGVLLVAGPAGVGKTTLVDRVLREADPATPLARGWCPFDAAPPLWPWRAALRRAGVTTVADADVEPAAAASARFATLATMSEALFSAGPLVVVIEDLHWADAASLDLLAQVAAGAAGTGLAVIGTVRSPAPEDVAVRLAALGRYGAVTLTLRPFTTEEIAEVVGAAAATEVLLRTGGLPLLVGAVRDGYGSADLATVVRTLLAALTPAQRAVIEAAAVLGDDIDEPLLASVVAAGGDPADVAGALAAAWRGGLLGTDAAGYRFVHALVRDGIVDLLEPAAVRQLHRTAAGALESAADADRSGRIAAHWRRAGTDAGSRLAAARWSRRAAEQARAARAYDDAVGHLADAVADLSSVDGDPTERAEATIDLAYAEYLAGRYDRCLEHSADASDAADAVGRGDLVARAALVLEGITFAEAAQIVPGLCQRALAYPDVPDATRARLLAQLAVMAADSGRISEAEAPARESLALAEASGDPHAEIAAARARELTLVHPDDTAERLRLGELVVDRAGVLGQPLAMAVAHSWRIAAGSLSGRVDIVADAMGAVERIAERSALPVARWHLHRTRAARALLAGAFTESVAESVRATAIARESGDTTAAGMYFSHGIRLAMVRGDPAALPEGWREALLRAPDMPLILVQGANAAALAGSMGEAREHYDRVVAGMPIPAEHPAWMAVLIELTDLVTRFADAASAEVAYRQLLPFRPYPGPLGTPTVYFVGTVSRYLGEYAATFGDAATAEELLREALVRNRGFGARPDTAATSLALARLLRAGGTGRDGLAEAARLAQDALDIANRLDMPGTVAAAGGLVAEIAAERDGADPLTAREREVAEMVADALTNRQIAAKLVLSERTVESHVRSILAKTQCANRTEFVARWTGR
ncbi:MAG TPA: AAA family ATPase [Micromonosporaceae bacterium]|nr:AAA family ATPase [Micromonosporaceae bacterium]